MQQLICGMLLAQVSQAQQEAGEQQAAVEKKKTAPLNKNARALPLSVRRRRRDRGRALLRRSIIQNEECRPIQNIRANIAECDELSAVEESCQRRSAREAQFSPGESGREVEGVKIAARRLASIRVDSTKIAQRACFHAIIQSNAHGYSV